MRGQQSAAAQATWQFNITEAMERQKIANTEDRKTYRIAGKHAESGTDPMEGF